MTGPIRDHHLVDGRAAAADPRAAAAEMVAFFAGHCERARQVEEETGAPPEPGGYVRHRIHQIRAHEERDRLVAEGVAHGEAARRAIEVADTDREARLRGRALARLDKVDELTRTARQESVAARTLIGSDSGSDTDALLSALDEAIGLHGRIARILEANRAAFDGNAYRPPGAGPG